MERNKFQIVVAIFMVVVLLGMVLVVILLGDVVKAQGQTAVSAVTPVFLQYQGRLSDPATGEPLPDGSYTMVFRFYKVAEGGTAIWTETKDVPVAGGLYSTALGSTTPLDLGLFNGQALWLGVKVGTDEEAAPRQQVLPVAYALSLVPGASIVGKSSNPILSVSNSGGGAALQAGGAVAVEGDLSVSGDLIGGAHTHSGAAITSGQVAEPRIAGAIARDSEVTSAISSHAANSSAHHSRYTDQEAVDAARAGLDYVTEYDFLDHLYGGMHSGRALAFGVINEDGSVASAFGNVTSRWNNTWDCYEITIAGHTYDSSSYATVVTPLIGGMTAAWGLNGKLCVGIYVDSQSPVFKQPFSFAVFQP